MKPKSKVEAMKAIDLLKIGNLEIEPRTVLAPMSGVTSSAFRRLIRELNPGTCGLMVTEFISIEAISRDNPRSLAMMDFEEVERPLSIQIFGYDIDRMVSSARLCEERGADIVDINCGCPAPKVVRRGGGCELMRQPQHLAKMLEAVKKSIDIPLTLKIRAGWDDTCLNGHEIAKIAQESGCEMLAVHPRTRAQLYRGEADWEIVRSIAQKLTIPVVGSGDVVDETSYRRAVGFGCAGVMIGRGAIMNPLIFRDIDLARKNLPVPRLSPAEMIAILRHYERLLAETFPPRASIGKLKQLASQMLRDFNKAKDFRRSLCLSSSVEDYLESLERWEAVFDRETRFGEAHMSEQATHIGESSWV